MKRLLSLMMLAALFVTTGRTQDKKEPDAAAIAALIKQLGSESFAERKQAGQALDKHGEFALVALEEAAASAKDPEIRRQARILADAIEARLQFATAFADKVLAVADQIHDTDVVIIPRVDLARWAVAGLLDEQTKLPEPLRQRLANDQADPRKLLRDVRLATARIKDPGKMDYELALQGMMKEVQKVDPYARFADTRQFTRDLLASLAGIGVRLDSDPDSKLIKVRGVFRGSSAQRSGLKAGDLIKEITFTQDRNGARLEPPRTVSMKGLTVEEAARELLGPPDTLVTLTVRRPGRPDDLTFKVVRRAYVPATVHPASRTEDDSPDYFLERTRGIAYVRIDALGRDSARDLELALKQLQAAGVKALIVDLRFNPGGLLLSSIDVSSRLISERRGLHMLTRSKEGHQLHAPEKGQRAAAVLDVPLVCLVNGDTASGAELIAAELQDYRRAVIMGERTKGKGSVQNILTLDADRQLVLTSALFLRATGKKLDRMAFQGRPADEWGVQPEREIKLTEEEANDVRSHLERMPLVVRDAGPRDRQLEAAIKYLSK